MSVADDKLILEKTAISPTMLMCPVGIGCAYFVEIPAVSVVEDIANALGMTGQGLAQLHAEQAAEKMRAHLQKHTVEEWLTKFVRAVR